MQPSFELTSLFHELLRSASMPFNVTDSSAMCLSARFLALSEFLLKTLNLCFCTVELIQCICAQVKTFPPKIRN